MTIAQLTSRNNSLLKTIRLVASGSRRAPANLVIAEGVRLLEEVQKCGCSLEAVLISEEFGSLPREKALLQCWISQNVRISRAASQLFLSASNVESPQGVLALVDVPEFSLDASTPERDALILFACGIQDPGNLGALIRASAAAGASMVCTSKGTVSARNPKVIRASAGAFFRLPVVERLDVSEFLDYCRRHAIRIYRTDVRNGLPHAEIDLKSRCAIVLGNEGSGLDEGGLKDIPAVHISMANDIESLNVATAGAILLFEASRQRGR